MDIRPPRKKRPEQAPAQPAASQQPTEMELPPPSITPAAGPSRAKKRIWLWVFVVISAILLLVSATAIGWYLWAIQPRSDDKATIRIVINEGDTANEIATSLYDHGLIRSTTAFNVYTQISKTRAKLQAGGYVLSPSQSVSSIVEHLTTGQGDTFNLTIPPGLTLIGLRELFEKHGFSSDEVDQAFSASYDHPILKSRPAGASLEGYIYPETYNVDAGAPLSSLITRSFDEMYKDLSEMKAFAAFKKHKLTLYEAITLASIVQQEVSDPADQRQVAQVFLLRLKKDMPLGSDVTFFYAAKIEGVEPSVDLDSPYNTRKYGGLPPGPIANMNPSALKAVAFPTRGSYLYFVAGDDGTTHFSKTEEEHNANVAKYCTDLCQ